jgi:peptidoglycan hydrolase-like protein with peptidoglycan-binding domain
VTRRKLAVPAVLVATAAAGAVTALAIRGGGAAAATTPAPVHLATAEIVMTDLSTQTLTAGTLGYAPTRPLVDGLAGTYTWLPAPGTSIAAGQLLYAVDNQQVILMTGVLPAWRPFEFGMTPGPDISQLQRGLIEDGDATGLLTAPTGQFDQLTADAVTRWQARHGYPVTGQITLGQIVFQPGPILVGAITTAVGEAAGPGQQPFQVTTNQRTVTVPVNPDLPPVQVGERVSIVLPTNATTPGKVVAETQLAGGANGATEQLVVQPDQPEATGSGSGVPVQVSLSIQSVHGVLAVPVTALLALRAGRFGVEVVTPSGAHRIEPVTAGIFAGGRVQVSGPGIRAGEKVVVSQ